MIEKARRSKITTVTDLVTFTRCERLAALKREHAEEIDLRRAISIRKGIQEHQKFEAQHDSRCFVASWALGESDPDTQKLRQWRDAVLLSRPWGRLVVKCYYQVSPWGIGLAQMVRFPRAPIERLLRWGVRKWLK